MSTTSDIYAAVKSHYSAASSNRSTNGTYESKVAQAFGYSEAELSSIPKESNLGLSCGNPIALAKLHEGETVVDLGCGAGFDVFLASPKVGETGTVIGVDMNEDMLEKARRNAQNMNGGKGAKNVKFVQAPITDMNGGVESGSVDCIISNCVVNLVPEEEKPLVFKEMHRTLKSGGRVAISDILIKDGVELPENLKKDMGLYVGCVAGASLVSGYQKYLKEAGFQDVLIVDKGYDLNVYNADDENVNGEGKSCCGTTAPAPVAKSCCGTTTAPSPIAAKSCCGTTAQTNGNGLQQVKVDLKTLDFNAYAGSYNIYAVKA
ncbi:hypothetical protein LTS08_006295 [Lithohypha guttulata]|nr:hypothetical protein LTS08_006295 [Lithohypha guttulata]